VNPGIKYLIAAFRNREFFVERVFADAAGAFHLEAVPAGMVLSLSGFASSTQPGVKELGPLPGKQEAKIEVRLDDGGSLQGKVVAESGKGISQATVAVVPLDLRRIIPLFRDFPAWTAQTNSKGDYIFPFLPKGNYLTIAQSIDGRSQPGQAILAGSASRAPDLLIPETQLIHRRGRKTSSVCESCFNELAQSGDQRHRKEFSRPPKHEPSLGSSSRDYS
jgi:hypothetical protein